MSWNVHAALKKELTRLRKDLKLHPSATEGTVLARLRAVIEERDERSIGNHGRTIRNAGEELTEARVRTPEQLWDFLRTLIEVFPLLGILGTVCSMAVSAVASSEEAASSERLAAVMESFGNAMYSTIAGLGAAAIALVVYGFVAKKVEHWFSDLSEFKRLVARAEHIGAGADVSSTNAASPVPGES